MSGICDTCSLSKGCRKPIGGVDSCRRYVRAKESNWKRLFGTPERAAWTMKAIAASCQNDDCDACPNRANESCALLSNEDELLEWLRGDSE